MSVYILVVDDEVDVEALFRQQFRRDLRSGRFKMEFATSAPMALKRAEEIRDASLILILSDINMPGMSGLEMLPVVRARRPGHHDHGVRRSGHTQEGHRARRSGPSPQTDRLRSCAA